MNEQTVSAQPSSGKEAVNLAQGLAELKTERGPPRSPTGPRTVGGRTVPYGRRRLGRSGIHPRIHRRSGCAFLGKAYFKLLGDHPELRMIFALGKRITWVSPSGTAVIIDSQGQDDADPAEPGSAVCRFKRTQDCHWSAVNRTWRPSLAARR